MTTGRSFPASEVRGGGREELPRVRGQGRPGGDTPGPRSGVVAKRSYPAAEEATSHPKPGAVALRSHLIPEAGAAAGRSNRRSGGCEGAGGLKELSHVDRQEGRW